MTRRYADPVLVRLRPDPEAGPDSAPMPGAEVGPWVAPDRPRLGQFLWRGRLYQVREVLASWVEWAPWWRGAAVQSLLDDGSAGPGSPEPRDHSGAVDESPIQAVPHQFWRVEAQAGRSQELGIFDLCHDPMTDRWLLVRSQD